MPEAVGRLERFASARLLARAPLRARSQAAIEGARLVGIKLGRLMRGGDAHDVHPGRAARPTPAGASSRTTQSSGAAPSSRAASR